MNKVSNIQYIGQQTGYIIKLFKKKTPIAYKTKTTIDNQLWERDQKEEK
jgi:hypothetical protein